MKSTRSWKNLMVGALIAHGGVAVATADVAVTRIWPDKLVYGFDAPGACTVTVAAPGTAMPGTNKVVRTARLKVDLLSRMDRVETLCDRAVEWVAGETQQIPLTFRTGGKKEGAEYGYEARATIMADGQSNSVAREFFLVTDNPLKIGHLTIPAAQTWRGGPDLANDVGLAMRRRYFCMAETPFWAPCDFSELTTQRDVWVSGQALRFMSAQGMKEMADGVHAVGGRIVIYANKWAIGPIGFEHARKHPDWYHWGKDWYGCNFDVEAFDALEEELQTGQFFKGLTAGPFKGQASAAMWCVCPLIARPEVAEFGIAQIVGSCRQFGWDGIRFDNLGWYVDNVKDILGNPAVAPGADIPKLEADLVRRIRTAGEKVASNFIYGDNMGFQTDIAHAPPKWLAEAANGGLVMHEGMNEISHPGGKLNYWAFLRNYLRQAIPTVRQAGGYPYGIVGGGNRIHAVDVQPGIPDHCIKYAMLMASGMHLCYGVAPDYGNYMRLYARYCGLLYDDALQFVGDPETMVTVTAPREIWWKEYVRRRDLADKTTQFIVHLINPSTAERFDEKNAAPPAQADIRVALAPPDGIKVRRAFRLTADGRTGPDSLELPVAADGGNVVVTVPELTYWNIVVFEGSK